MHSFPSPSAESVTLALRDNVDVRIRPLIESDRDQLVEGFGSLSEASRYQRFFTPIARLSTTQLAYLTEIDHIRHFAWGVESLNGAGIGIARYVRSGPGIAEAAFTITDAFQGHGLGWRMLQALAMVASDNGFTAFEMMMLAENRPMAHLARKAGAGFGLPANGTIRAELNLEPEIWSDLPAALELRLLAKVAAHGG